jgi:hypothetical protein
VNFEPSEEQAMIARSFAGFLDEHSSIYRVRAALPSGFDPSLWRSLAEMGALESVSNLMRNDLTGG